MKESTIIIVFLAAFALGIICGPIYIPLLRRLKFGQTIRDDGPKTHLTKQGIPTIGGLIFLTPILIVTIICAALNVASQLMPLLIATVGFGFVGFLDDFLKIKKKSKDGLFWYQKLIALGIVAALFNLYLIFFGPAGYSQIHLDLFGLHWSFNISWFFIPYSILVLLSSTNAVNLTDGLDGLCAGSTFIVFIAFAGISLVFDFADSVTLFSVICAGSVLSFLFFNFNPAKVFMGDTGSLAIGGALGACILVLQRPILLILAGLLFVIEALSVLLQVGYFKLTKGKRLFRMAPIHHHFELCGWKERKVVFVFWAFTALCCVIAYYSIAL